MPAGVEDKRLVDLEALCRLMRAHRLTSVTIGDVSVHMEALAFQSPPQANMPMPTGAKEDVMPSDDELLTASSGIEAIPMEDEEAVELANPFKRTAP